MCKDVVDALSYVVQLATKIVIHPIYFFPEGELRILYFLPNILLKLPQSLSKFLVLPNIGQSCIRIK